MTTWDDVRRALASSPPTRVAETGLKRAAVALILREGARGLDLLFIRRAEHPDDPWSGQIGFPGGRAEKGDADPRITAMRETAEEIGVDLVESAEFLGALDEVRAMAQMRPQNLVIAPFVFRLGRPVVASLSNEVGSVHWLPLDELRDPERRSTMEYVHEGTTLHFPCLRFEDLAIWGLTFRMFSNFEALLGDLCASEASGLPG